MIIKLNDDLIQKTLANNFSHEEIRCLNSICTSRVRGFHFVIGSRKLLSELSKMPSLCDDSRAIFRTIYNDQTRWNQLLNEFGFIVHINVEKFVPYSQKDEGQINLYVSLGDFLHHSLDAKANIIAEHLNDTRFYEGMLRAYFAHRNIRGVNLVYKNVLGGGSTTHEVLDEIYLNLDGVSFCILDRDTTSPDVVIGETAKKVIESIPKGHFSQYHVIDSRELENIIPSSLMREMFSNNKAQKAKLERYQKIRSLKLNGESPIKYVDFKKGIKLALSNCVNCDKTKKYWREVLSASGFDLTCSFKDTCNSPKKCKCLLLDGFGTDLLKSSVKHINSATFDYSKIDEDTSFEWNAICLKIAPYMIAPRKKSA